MKYIEETLLVLTIAALVFIVGWVTGRTKSMKEPATIVPVHHWHTEIQYDTINAVQWKTKTQYKTDTVELQTIQHDTVTVELPLSLYVFDTLGVHAAVTGHSVTLDTLQVERKITTDSVLVPVKNREWHWGVGVALGVGYVK